MLLSRYRRLACQSNSAQTRPRPAHIALCYHPLSHLVVHDHLVHRRESNSLVSNLRLPRDLLRVLFQELRGDKTPEHKRQDPQNKMKKKWAPEREWGDCCCVPWKKKKAFGAGPLTTQLCSRYMYMRTKMVDCRWRLCTLHIAWPHMDRVISDTKPRASVSPCNNIQGHPPNKSVCGFG